jgi:hypothetical protein
MGWLTAWLIPGFPPVSSTLDGEDLLDTQGPDDLWPAEQLSLDLDVPQPRPEVLVGEQWGIKLPSGEVEWNMWAGTHLNNPLDRAQMIARIQKHALDAGYSEQQFPEFLAPYKWVTRNQIATVVYEDTGCYSLTDPAAIALGAPNDLEDTHDDDESGFLADDASTTSDSACSPMDLGGADHDRSGPDPVDRRVCHRPQPPLHHRWHPTARGAGSLAPWQRWTPCRRQEKLVLS